MFVTPEGVLAIRVTDSPDAALPFQLRVDVNQNVRVYLNHGFYAKAHAPWVGTADPQPGGFVVTANRPKSCQAAWPSSVKALIFRPTANTYCWAVPSREKPSRFYIAPGSSYENSDPAAAAWRKARAAQTSGFKAARKQTAQWWKEFYAHSGVNLPDPDLATWSPVPPIISVCFLAARMFRQGVTAPASSFCRRDLSRVRHGPESDGAPLREPPR